MRTYHQQLARHETRRCLYGLIPRAITDWARLRRYRRAYEGAVVTAGSRVQQGAKLAPGVIVRNSIVSASASIERFSTLGEQCRLAGIGRISIGQFCSIGPGCSIRSDNHKLDRISTYPFNQVVDGGDGTERDYEPQPVSIGNDVWVGEGVTILPGAHLGDGCVVAARTVVTRGDYPPFSVIAGMPGRVIRMRMTEDKAATILANPWWDESDDRIFGELLHELTDSIAEDES